MNKVGPLTKQHWTKSVQALLEEMLVALDLANLRDMPSGTTLNNPRGTRHGTDDYTKYTDVTDRDLHYTNEQLVINQTPIDSFVYDDIDGLENSYDAVSNDTKQAALAMKRHIEGNFFAEYANAGNKSASVTALTAGTTGNTFSTYGGAYATLINEGVDADNIVACTDAFQIQKIGEASLNNTFKVADESYKRGYKGMFQNMKMYMVNNLTATTTLALATNPTANDTVTINGVTFTFKATASVAGDVVIAGSAAATLTNLVAAINGTGAGDNTDYTELSARNRSKVGTRVGISAVAGTGEITLTSNRGYKVVSSALTAAADKFAQVVIHNLIMEKGSIDLAIQKEVSLKIQDVQKQLGSRYMTWTRYGLKTFSSGAEKMFDLLIEAQAAE